MEKRKAHYSLEEVKKLIEQGNYEITQIASKNARKDFSFMPEKILETILKLNPKDLYKSMTSDYDNKLWQDVYHKEVSGQIAYIKIQIEYKNSIIIQFKKK